MIWDKKSRRYRDKNGRFISEQKVRELVIQAMATQRDPLDVLSRRLINKEITVELFEKLFKELIKGSYIISYTAGRGGRNMMTSSDWGVIGKMLRGQYEYLNGFIRDIQNGRYKSPEAIRVRSQLYINSSTQAYERGKSRAWGTPDLPAYPGQDSECKANCKCFWEIVSLGNGNFDCYWRLTSGESCPTCVGRASQWSPLKIRANEKILNAFLMGNKFNLDLSTVLRNVEVGANETTYTFVGFPYSGPIRSETLANGSDLHGTSFTPETDLGWTERAIPVYWEHGRGELGATVLGRAYVDEETEEGRLLKVVIERRNKYHDFLLSLNELGILRGSGHAIDGMYDFDDSTGKLRMFHLAEYSMTVTPSNDNAKPVDLEKIRNIFIENKLNFERYLDFMADKKQKTAEEIALEEKARAAGGSGASSEEENPEEDMSEEERMNMKKEKGKRSNHAEEIARMFTEEKPAETLSADMLAVTEVLRVLREEVASLRSLLEETIDGQVELARGIQNLPSRVAAEKRSFSSSEIDIYSRKGQKTEEKQQQVQVRGSGFTHFASVVGGK